MIDSLTLPDKQVGLLEVIKYSNIRHSIMPYYGLFSCDLHILDLQWRSHCADYVLWIIPLYALLLGFMTHYDITMGHEIA